MPLIPGLTDTYDNLRDIFDFMSEVGLPSVSLLSYNASASAKYEWLGMEFSLEAETQTQEQLDAFLSMARRKGIDARIG